MKSTIILPKQLSDIQHLMLPNLEFSTRIPDIANNWINRHVQSGIEGEPENLTQEEAYLVSHMDESGHHLMTCKQPRLGTPIYFGPYFIKKIKTTLGHKALSLAVFRGKTQRTLSEEKKNIIWRLSPVGANGIKTLIEPKDISFYMNDLLKPILDHLIPMAQGYLFLDCHSGLFNIKCSEDLRDEYEVPQELICYTSKRHTDKYYKKLWHKAEKLRPFFKNKELLDRWVKPYLDRDSFEDPATGLKGRYIHKSGRTRKIPELDRIYVHKVEDRLKRLCRNHWERTGKKALIILFDDTMSRYANSAKSVINQIGKYANVIVIVTMFEF